MQVTLGQAFLHHEFVARFAVKIPSWGASRYAGDLKLWDSLPGCKEVLGYQLQEDWSSGRCGGGSSVSGFGGKWHFLALSRRIPTEILILSK